MNQLVDEIIRDSVGLGVLLLVLVGLYRLLGRMMTIAETGFDRFLNDFTRIADGIAEIARNTTTRKN